MSSHVKQDAQQLKQQGNKYYGEHRFAAAFKAYKEASTMDPSEPIFIANQSAVLFEAGLYARCIELCDIALSKLSDDGSSKDLCERLRLRKAKSLFLSGEFENTCLFMQQFPSQSSEEWKAIQESAKSYSEHHQRCNRTENQPLGLDCSVPSVRASLLPLFHPFDLPIAHDVPTSILQTSQSASYPSLLDLSAQYPQKRFNFLFAQNTDPRHLLKTLTHATSLMGTSLTEQIPSLTCYVQEQNAKTLARFILILFVLGHPDLDEKRAQMASDFVYFIWLGVGLIPPHWTMLSETLHELCKLSFNLDTWRLDARSGWITFADERDLKLVRDCWIMWGTSTENPSDSKKALLAYREILDAQSTTPLQRRYADIPDSTYRKNLECTREADFFNQFRMVLPRPPMLEDDNEIPPKSMTSWMLNPTICVSDSSIITGDQMTTWIPEPRPDAIFPFSVSQPREPLQSFSLYTCEKIFEAVLAIKKLKKASKLTIRAFCGNFVDLCDLGSRLGSVVAEEAISFDRIHTGNLIEALSGFEVFVNSLLLLNAQSVHSAFFSSLTDLSLRYSSSSSSSSIGPFSDLDHFLYNKIRLDKSQLESRFGCHVSRLNDQTLVWSQKRPLTTHGDEMDELSKFDALFRSNTSYKTEYLINNVFVMCAISVPTPTAAVSSLTDAKGYFEPAAPNLMSFVRFLNSLLLSGTPAHWITSSIELIMSGSIRASMLDTAAQSRNSQKIRSFSTTSFLTELKTLLTIVAGKRLSKMGLLTSSLNILEQIDECHWFQAENVPIQNYLPTIAFPCNPSISILIVDNRVAFNGQINLAERIATIQGQSQFLEILEAYSKHIDIVTSVYWTGPPKIQAPSQVTFGFWLPPSFSNKAKPTSSFTLILFRTDIYMCVGLSRLSVMTCTTENVS
jgi:tetratricopeptide (TPR) repeat protein